MKKIKFIFVACLLFVACKAQETPAQFSEEALNDTFITIEGDDIAFKDILAKYNGKQVVIDVWASWCKDCLKGLPKVKKLQEEYPEVVYLFLSLDRAEDKWKRGIERHKIKGEHYYMQSGWKGAFGKFLDLDWIPRYLVIDKQGNIKLYKAVEADDKKIIETLN